MTFFSRLFAPVVPKRPVVVVKPEWMPAASMKRVILHWTAGSYIPSSLDKEHYHFLIDGSANLVRGKHSIKANEFIGSKTSDYYAAHTKGTNTGSIGVSLCGSANAVERPFDPGEYPIKEVQWQAAAEAVACLCVRYGISVTDKTVLTHAEVQTNLGVRQNGKWDIAHLVFGSNLTSAKACGDDFRRRVCEVMEKI